MIRSKRILESLAAAAMIVVLSACAGGGGGGGGGGGDVLGGDVSVPDEPQYSEDGTKLADAPNGTEFPLLQAEGYYKNGGGDITSLPGERKASITPLADGMRLKVQDFMNVEFRDEAHRSVDNDVVTYTKNVNGRQVVLQLYSALVPGLDYMELGAWAVSEGGPTDVTVGVGVGVGGYETHPDDMPTSGTASYSGKMVGVAVDTTGNAYDLIGNASMDADFLNNTVSGQFTGTEATNVETSATSNWNDVTFTGSIVDDSNRFSGTAVVTADHGSLSELDVGASGVIEGKFFGPVSGVPDEAGGAWTLEDSSGNVATGAFAVD